MEHHSGYKHSNLLLGMRKIAKLLVKSNESDYKYKVYISLFFFIYGYSLFQSSANCDYCFFLGC